MNLTLAALSISHLSNSPLISPASYRAKPCLSFDNLKMHNFFSSFLKDNSISSNINIFHSIFNKFLDGSIIVDRDESLIKRQIFLEYKYYDYEHFTIIGCTFQNINHPTDRGGAIEYKSEKRNPASGYVTLYSSTFDNCSASDGDGGAIFVCHTAKKTGYDSEHEMTSYFNSSYCCYSRCSAYQGVENNTKGYGPVMFIFANKIEVFYSSSVECPYENESFGAQYDLFSDTIKSSYINASSQSARYCSGMEYRNANQGFFTFQTFIGLHGGFMSSFTNLKDTKSINMSYCNFVNNTIRYLENQQSSIIYVRNCPVFLSNFCFIDIKLDDRINFSIVCFSDNKIQPVSLINSVLDDSIKSYLPAITTNNVRFYKNDETKNTNTIKLLDLGKCKGELEPPPTIFSSIFTPSNIFTETTPFTKSSLFSSSKSFDPSSPFTKSKGFSASKKFSSSEKFSKSSVFTQSKPFTKSDTFTESNTFKPTKHFRATNFFTKSNTFTPSESFSPSITFTASDHFTESSKFTKSSIFTPSSKFTPSSTFSASNRFTQSSTFSASSKFTSSSTFSPSNKFTKSDAFTQSNLFKPTPNFDATCSFASNSFTASNKFTSSNLFSHSNKFTFSNQFSQSENFNATKIFKDGGPIDIKINEDKEGNISEGMKIGIGVTVGAVALAAVIAVIIWFRRRKMNQNNFNDEEIEVREDTGSSVVTANPLVSMMNNDDPFEDSFQSNPSFSQILANPSLHPVPSSNSIKSMRSNVSLGKLPSQPGLNDPLTNESIHHMPSSPSVNRINENPSLHQVGSTFNINDHLADS